MKAGFSLCALVGGKVDVSMLTMITNIVMLESKKKTIGENVNKHLKKLVPFTDKHPRLMATLLSPIILTWVPVTIFIMYPLAVLEEGLMNRKRIWEEFSDAMLGALDSWSYCLIKGERGEW